MHNADQGLDESIDDQTPAEQQEDGHGRQDLGWMGWLISFGVHVTLLIIMYLVVFGVPKLEEDPPAVRVSPIEAPPKKEEKEKERALEEKVEINIATESDTPAPITALNMPVEKVSREEESDNPDPKGREEAVADSEMGGQGAFMAIGAGGGSAGMFGKRSGGGRKRAVGAGGGSKGSESAVEAGLRWLKRHQSPNGMWDVINYPANCTEPGPKCEPGEVQHGTKEGANAAMTGYALLCFLGAGYDHKSPNRFRDTVKRGLEYAVSIQQADGRFGPRNYEHPILAMAVAEAFAMTGDIDLKVPAQRAMDVIAATQAEDPQAVDKTFAKLGWDYVKANPGRNDSSVSGWNVMALKSGLAAGLDVSTALQGSKNWLERTWKTCNPGWEKLDVYTGESIFPYTFDGVKNTWSFSFKDGVQAPTAERDLTCVGLVSAVFLGHGPGDIMLETMANRIVTTQTPASYAEVHTYYNYYNTLGMFQVGGDRWKKWNDSVRDVLVNAMRSDAGCFDGSWDYANTKKWPGLETGRTLSTAYAILSLEVYYRYAQVAGTKGKGAKK
jgi:hypothetical protein